MTLSCWMFVTTSVRAPSCHEDVRTCALTCFIPYPVHKFRLTSSFFHLWIWHISVLMLCNFLSAEYVRVRLVNFIFFFLSLHAVQTFFCTIFLCLHVLSCPVSFCLHYGFDSFSSCLLVGLDFLLVWLNLNHIFNTILGWGWSYLKGIYVFPLHYHVTKFREQWSL